MAERGILEQAYGQLIPQGMRPNYAAPRTSVEPTPMVGRGEIRPYTFSWRDMAKQWLGSIGMSDNTANAVITLADFTPVGAAFVGNEARRAVTRGERLAPAAEVAMAAIPLPMAAKRAAASKGIQLLEDWISKSKDQTFNGPNAIDAIKRRGFDAGFGKNYELKLVKTSDVKPSQFGEDYLNESSKYTASNILNAKSIKDISREADLLPITLDETLNIMDGNHRHAAAILNGDEYIPALVPVGEGYGKIINLDSFGASIPNKRAASKVVREVAQEVPSITAYHGSPYSFDRFDIEKAGTNIDPGALGRAVYATTDESAAKLVGERMYEVNMELSNPLRISPPDWRTPKTWVIQDALGIERTKKLTPEAAQEITDIAKSKGYDGVVYDYSALGYPHQEVAAFDDKLITILKKYSWVPGMAIPAAAIQEYTTMYGVAPNLGGETPSVTVY